MTGTYNGCCRVVRTGTPECRSVAEGSRIGEERHELLRSPVRTKYNCRTALYRWHIERIRGVRALIAQGPMLIFAESSDQKSLPGFSIHSLTLHSDKLAKTSPRPEFPDVLSNTGVLPQCYVDPPP